MSTLANGTQHFPICTGPIYHESEISCPGTAGQIFHRRKWQIGLGKIGFHIFTGPNLLGSHLPRTSIEGMRFMRTNFLFLSQKMRNRRGRKKMMMGGGWWVSIKYCQNHYLLSAGLPAPNYLLSASLHCQLQIPKIQSFSQNWGNFG